MNRIGVLQVIDTLNVGGAERVAVNLANLLPRTQYTPYLCSTRADGPLADSIAPDVGRVRLGRKGRFDPAAIWNLSSFVRTNQIKIIHAHGTSLFISQLASLIPPRPVVVWHDHHGRYLFNERPAWLYRMGVKRLGGVMAVNQPLAKWAEQRLGMAPDRVWYIPNFVRDDQSHKTGMDLPGQPGKRIVCVANLRQEKDHLTLVRAMALLIQVEPEAHLLLIGAASDSNHLDLLSTEIVRLGIDRHVSLLGSRQDVPDVLANCDIGVLSSVSEGFPLALMEYGIAKLPVVATRVGQCPEILEEGKAGILVDPGSPEVLSQALLILLGSSERRRKLGETFHRRIQQAYNADSIVRRVCAVYDSVLGQ